MNEIVFYNGFNLLVDIIIASLVAYATYRLVRRSSYYAGYTDGVNDMRHEYYSKHGVR